MAFTVDNVWDVVVLVVLSGILLAAAAAFIGFAVWCSNCAAPSAVPPAAASQPGYLQGAPAANQAFYNQPASNSYGDQFYQPGEIRHYAHR